MEKKRYKLKINALTESEAIHSLREAYDEVMREHAVSKQLIPRTALQVRAFNAYDVEMPQHNGISIAGEEDPVQVNRPEFVASTGASSGNNDNDEYRGQWGVKQPHHYSQYPPQEPEFQQPVFADPMINRLHQQTFNQSYQQQQHMPDQQGYGRGQHRAGFMNAPSPSQVVKEFEDEHMHYHQPMHSTRYDYQGHDQREFEDANMGNTNMRRRGDPPVWGKGLNRNHSYGPTGQGGN